MTRRVNVSPTQVAAAKLKVKRAEAAGREVASAIRAIAEAKPPIRPVVVPS